MPRLSRPAFRIFLAAKKPTYRFRAKPHQDWVFCCPLACFLGVEVGTSHYDDTKPLPKWARSFVRMVDEVAPNDSIFAKRALAILDSIK